MYRRLEVRPTIIVVGGRIAGTLTAALLAQQGERVLLLERFVFPHPTISISVFFQDVLAVFDRVGFGEVLDAQGFPRISYLAFEFPDHVWIKGTVPTYSGRSWGYAIRRDVLDNLLLQHLKQMPNVTVWEGCTVTDVLKDEGGVAGVVCRLADGTEMRIPSEVVIGADGKWSALARCVQALQYDVRQGRTCSYYSYYRGVIPVVDQPSFVAYCGSSPFNYHLFSVDVDSGLTGVGIETSSDHFDEFRKAPGLQLEQCIVNVPELATRMREAQRITPVMGLRFPSAYRRRPYGRGWALVGDAGMLQDPITGQGLSNAAFGAQWLSEAILRWRQGVPWNRALDGYQRTRDQFTETNYNRTHTLTDFSNDLPNWILRWYRNVGAKKSETERYLKMICNAIPPERFYSLQRLIYARLRYLL